jgi:hypothetical protein
MRLRLRPRLRPRLRLAASALVLSAAGLGGAWAWQLWQLQQVGEQLFDGRQPLGAQIQGHAEPLPPAAARCSNCHVTQAVRQGAAAAGLAGAAFAPLLTAATLDQDLPRRGGPPSRFDAASLCRLLRDGIDPAWVMLPKVMPRYQVSDAQCVALWTHLTRS